MPRLTALTVALLSLVTSPDPAQAQETAWAVDATIGYAGLVDESTDHLLVAGGSVRRYLSPRLSVGPELVAMKGDAGGDGPDLALMLTGNVVFDLMPPPAGGPRRLTPFLIGGLGVYRQRTPLLGGPFWSSDPAFTAGGGIRARVASRVLIAAEYRIGWELHQRITGSVTIELR